MEHQAYIKFIRMSPKKLRFIVASIKKMSPSKAATTLLYDNKRGSKVLYKVIKSAMEGAKRTLKTEENLLQFKVLAVEEGPALKRSRPGGRGTMKPYKKRSAHLKVILTVSSSLKSTKKNVQTEKKDQPVKAVAQSVLEKPAAKKPVSKPKLEKGIKNSKKLSKEK